MKKKYNVEGMSCAACSNAVHNILMKDPNINSAEVNLLMKQVLIVSKKECDLTALNSKLSAGGFKLSIEPVVVKPISTKLIIVLLLLALLLLYIGMSHMISFIVLPLPKVIHYNSSPIGFAIIQFILATIIMIMGFKIYRTGLKSLFRGIPNMDSLVAIGTLSAYSYSIYSTIEIMMGNSSYVHSLYYESAGVVVALVMLGNMLEERSKSKTFDAISALMNLQAKTCTILLNNEQLIVDIESLEKEQLLLIKPGEIIPSDSIIVEGTSAVNEAMLSGEGLPINKYVGDKLIGGTINLTNVLIARVSEIGENTTIKRMIKLVEDAQSIKAPIARIADKISAIFVPCVIIIAIFLTIGWIVAGATISFALSIFVSVMVIACPCALGLATPTAIMVATGVASKQGIYIKSGEALENINHIDTIVFDKTGTITSGKPVVTKVISYIDEEELIRITSSLEKNSNHPYAKAIIDYATSKNLLATNTIISNDISGKGLNGTYKNSNIVVGSYSYIKESNTIINITKEDTKTIDSLLDKGNSVIYIAIDNKLSGIIGIGDEIKHNAKYVIEQLHSMHKHIILLSGDHKQSVKAIANKLNIDEFHAEVNPIEKGNIIDKLKLNKNNIAMIGDGINDAIALSKANIAIAIGSGSDLAIECADVVLVKDNLEDVLKAFRLSKKTIRNIHQNLFWAFFYNTLGIPIAGGLLYLFGGPLLTPVFAGTAMALSSIFVVGNALRLNKFK